MYKKMIMIFVSGLFLGSILAYKLHKTKIMIVDMSDEQIITFKAKNKAQIVIKRGSTWDFSSDYSP